MIAVSVSKPEYPPFFFSGKVRRRKCETVLFSDNIAIIISFCKNVIWVFV